MNRTTRRLLPFLLFVVFLFAGNSLASRATNVTLRGVQDCATACTQKRDVSLARCSRLPEDRKTTCTNTANAEYDKCNQSCTDGGQNIGGEGKP